MLGLESESLDKKRKEYLQTYIRGEKSSGKDTSKAKGTTKKSSRKKKKAWWEMKPRDLKSRKYAKRPAGAMGEESKRRLSTVAKAKRKAKKQQRRGHAVKVSGYSYKRGRKTIKVKGYRRGNPN